jgi:Domain of unknown function (DUF4352)
MKLRRIRTLLSTRSVVCFRRVTSWKSRNLLRDRHRELRSYGVTADRVTARPTPCGALPQSSQGRSPSSAKRTQQACARVGFGRLLILAATGLVLAAGCGTQTITTTTTVGQTKGSGPQTQGSQRLQLGDSATLAGNEGEQMSVTLTQVLDPVTGDPDVDQPDPGDRYIGIMITLDNVGNVVYSDSPSNGATLIAADGQQAQSETSLSAGPCSGDFAADAEIAPGESQSGCIAFEMPSAEQPARFQFTLSSGFANETAEWVINASTPATSVPQTSTTTGPEGVTGTQPPTQTQPGANTNFKPGDQNPNDGHAADCENYVEVGLHSDCSVAEQVVTDITNGAASVPGSDTVTDNANEPGEQLGQTITFNCSDVGPASDTASGEYVKCISSDDPADCFEFEQT